MAREVTKLELGRMKRSYSTYSKYQPSTTKEERFAKIARNPKSLAYRQQRQMVLYKAPVRTYARNYQPDYRPELKFFDDDTLNLTFDNTAIISTDASTGLINLIPQGDTQSTRDGRQCTIESIQIKGVIEWNPTTALPATGATYMYLILDTQANGSTPVVLDVVTSTDLSRAFMNLSNSKRFKIIKKFVHTWNPPAGDPTTALNYMTRNIDFYKKCNIPLEFSSTTGALTEVKSNNLFMLYGSQNTGTDGGTIFFVGRSRIRFRG